MQKKIAIVGCGASGLTAIKCCLDEGLVPVCLERTDHIGGLWHYSDDVIEGQGSVMRSTVVNTSKETMCYSDFPIAADFPPYMHHSKVLEYLRLYATSFEANRYVRFNTEVQNIEEAPSMVGKWIVTSYNKTTKKIIKEVYDGVMICIGHHTEKYIPKFEGLKSFTGKVIHSHQYRHPAGYDNKRVLVIGIGNSGADIAVELSRVASQVYLSTRRGTWVVPRIYHDGYPIDLVLVRRISIIIKEIFSFSHSILNSFLEYNLNKFFNHANYGLQAKERFTQLQPTVCDDLPNRIICGSVIVKSDIKCIGPTFAEFKDGTRVEDLDAIVLATGYKFWFPFVDHPGLAVKDNEANLFKHVFPPDIPHGTLAVIGCIVASGAIPPISEIQCRWAIKVFKGEVKLPTKEEMEQDIAKKREYIHKHSARNSKRYTIRIDNTIYSDELAQMIGCKPNFGRLFLTDPRLALACVFGPFSFYQYRLVGPGQWPGARRAIMTIWDRTLRPTRTRVVNGNEPSSYWRRRCYHILGAVLLALLLVALLS